MGMQTAPAQLFYDFCLDDHVPEHHLLRRIDRFLDLEKVRTELKPFYSNIGRPSIDPELMIRMLIVGYCMGIRSERRARRFTPSTLGRKHRRPPVRLTARKPMRGQSKWRAMAASAAVPDHRPVHRRRAGLVGDRV